MITKQNIIDQLNEFYLKHKKIPTKKQYESLIDINRYGTTTIKRLFKSWNNCLIETFGKVNQNTGHPSILYSCKLCNKSFMRRPCDAKKSKTGNFFCCMSCAAIYNNKIKKKSRRSKIEIQLYNLLVKEFPNLDILPNDKTMLGGLEVDIAIPSLKLAIEWNGIVHFKPIYGIKKLKRVQEIDQEKLKIASNKNINLIIISDYVSNQQILNKAFEDIKNIIKNLQ